MKIKKEATDILYVRGVTVKNKKFLEKTSSKNKVSVAKVLNTILDKRRIASSRAKKA